MRSLQSMTHFSDPDDILNIAVSENLQKYISWKCFQSHYLSCIRSDFVFTRFTIDSIPRGSRENPSHPGDSRRMRNSLRRGKHRFHPWSYPARPSILTRHPSNSEKWHWQRARREQRVYGRTSSCSCLGFCMRRPSTRIVHGAI